jgi:hypothetical protein
MAIVSRRFAPPRAPALSPLLAVAFASAAAAVTISNVEPRRDTDGDIISAGDGCISYHPDEQLYYLFGAHYQPCPEPDNRCYAGDAGLAPCQTHQKVAAGQCCGWRNATIASWSSPDLVTWKKQGLDILPLLSGGSTMSSSYMAVFEPCGFYNRKTGFWVLYFLRDGYVLANAVARTAAGPFDVLQWDVPVPFMTKIVDFYGWQNASTGELIMKHNSESAGEYAVTLSDDYLSIVGSSAVFGHEDGYTEGGGIFQHGGASFVMAGYGCCFCPLGSNGFVWRSDDGVLGTYAALGDKVPRYANGSSVTQAQQFSVTPVYTSTGVVPMFIGIRFGSAPDFVKDHDFQYWTPLRFDESNDVLNVSWLDSFELDLLSPAPPPPPPAPPAPWYVCSFTALGACVEVPAGAPGAVASLDACQTACVPRYGCSPDGPPGSCVAVPANMPGANATLGGCEASCTPRYSCAAPASPGVCTAVAGDFPGASATLAECQALCVLCALGGTWFGGAAGVPITIAQAAPSANGTAAVRISVPAGSAGWGSNATGFARAGSVTITGGWCGAAHCVGVVSPLEAGGPNCARIDWAEGTWCSPAIEPVNCKYGSSAPGGRAGGRRF